MNSNNCRARLLAGASVAVIASTLGMGMHAAMAQTAILLKPGTTNISSVPPFNVVYPFQPDTAVLVATSPLLGLNLQYNAGTIGAGIGFSSAGAFVTTASPTVTVDSNAIEAIAYGNSLNTYASPLPGQNAATVGASLVNEPAAFVSTQIVSGSIEATSVFSEAGFNLIGTEIERSYTSGAISVGSNTIEALTQLNVAAWQIDVNSAPTEYFSSGAASAAASQGSFTLNIPPVSGTVSVSTGNVNVLTSQFNNSAQAEAGSGAELYDNTVGAFVDGSDPVSEAISATISVQNNNLAANYQGNAADAGITVIGSGSTFYGSLVLATEQANLPDAAGSPLAALNAYSTVAVELAAEDGGSLPVNTLAGTVTVGGNTISANATGNYAGVPSTSEDATGNIITLAAGLSVNDSAGFPFYSEDNPGGFGLTDQVIFPGGSNVSSQMAADIILANVQKNTSSPLTSVTSDGSVYVDVQQIAGGTVLVGGAPATNSAGNAITATVIGSTAYNAVDGGGLGSESITATIAEQNIQINDDERLVAVAADNEILVTIATPTSGLGSAGGTVSSAEVEVGSQTAGYGNTIGAVAVGNQASNNVSLDVANLTDTPVGVGDLGLATTLGIDRGSASGATIFVGGEFEPGGAAIINVQSNQDSPVVAVNADSSVLLLVGNGTAAIENSTLGIDNNALVAQAFGNTASSRFDLDITGSAIAGGTVSGGLEGNAVIGSAQTQNGDVVAVLAEPQVELNAKSAFEGSTVTVTGNVLAASAEANQVGNTIALNTVSFENGSGGGATYTFSPSNPALPYDGALSGGPTAYAPLAILNDQLAESDVTAVVDSHRTNPIEILFDNDFAGTAYNDSNYIGALATGNGAANSISLVSNGGIVDGYPSLSVTIGAITNIQTVDPASISADVRSFDAGIVTQIVDDTDGTVTLSDNEYQARAIGNDATNTASITGANQIQPDAFWGSASEPLITDVLGLVQDHGTLVVANAQATDAGTVSASLSDSSVLARLGTAGGQIVLDSTVTLNGNQFLAQALDNAAGNAITLSATDILDSTAAVSNQQESLHTTTEASAGSFRHPVEVEIQLGTFLDGDLVDTATLSVTDSQIWATALANQAANSIQATSGNVADTQSSLPSSWAGTPPIQGVESNTDWFAALGFGSDKADYNGLLPGTIGGDYAIGNLQVAEGNVRASADGEAAIQLNGTFRHPTLMTEVTATVSGNSTAADAEGNVAVNQASLTVANGSTDGAGAPTIAIGSWQVAGNPATTGTHAAHAISATADDTFWIGGVTTFNAGVVDGSTLTVSDNTASAAALANDAANGITVSAGNSLGDAYATSLAASGYFDGYGQAGILYALGIPTTTTAQETTSYAVADYAIGNTQNDLNTSVFATASVGSFFSPAGLNLDHYDTEDSTLTVSGNWAQAEAGANTATNTLSVTTAGGSLSTTGAILNSQNNYASATADATGILGIRGAGIDTGIDGSTLSVSANNIVAAAWGNSATNSLTASASTGLATTDFVSWSVYGPGEYADGDSVAANQVILNEQLNEGAVTATATGLVGVRTGSGEVTDSVVGVTNNTVSATATGSSAINTMALNTPTGGAASFVDANGQVNTAPINATVTGTAIGVFTGGFSGDGVTAGGALNVTGNLVLATATGNAAANNVGTDAAPVTGSSALGVINNVQTNFGAVTATVTDTAIGVLSTGSVTNTPINVSGNGVQAQATGNSAINSMVLNSGGSPEAIVANYQTNTGNVTATVSGANVGITGFGTVSGGTMNVSGNEIVAMAGGNASSTTVVSKH